MISSVTARVPILTLTLFLFGIGHAFAHNKVVVIPLGGDDGAGFSEKMTRIPPDQQSGSGDSVRDGCGSGSNGFDNAAATISSKQQGGRTEVTIKLTNGKPDTLYDLWLRLGGADQDGNSFGRSPLTGGGATPLAASTNLDQFVADWIGSGSSLAPANGFITDDEGTGKITLELDFPLEGGAHPFNNISAGALDNVQTRRPSALATPTAIADPRQAGVDAPYLIRMVSHCQDGLSHGLSPGVREAWFNFP